MPRTPKAEHERLEEIAEAGSLQPLPRRPVRGECCERLCDPCVWDYYERALDRWCDRESVSRALSDALTDS